MQQNLTHLTQTFRGPTLYADQNMQEKKTKIEKNVTKKKINLNNLINVMNQKKENLIIHPTVNLQILYYSQK